MQKRSSRGSSRSCNAGRVGANAAGRPAAKMANCLEVVGGASSRMGLAACCHSTRSARQSAAQRGAAQRQHPPARAQSLRGFSLQPQTAASRLQTQAEKCCQMRPKANYATERMARLGPALPLLDSPALPFPSVLAKLAQPAAAAATAAAGGSRKAAGACSTVHARPAEHAFSPRYPSPRQLHPVMTGRSARIWS